MSTLSPGKASLTESISRYLRAPQRRLAIYTLAQRELTRFFRQPTRVIGAIGQPMIFWILFGSGLRDSFVAPQWAGTAKNEMTFQEYFFPGIAVLIVLFTAIFSTISIIEDRREGFLQGVLAAPVPRASIVLGKLCGGTILAMFQAGLFLAIGPLLSYVGLAPDMKVSVSPQSALLALLFLGLLSFQLTALGYAIAWPMSSTQGFHAIMSVFLMPMWLLSGAFFPAGQSGWLSWIICLNPLTYGLAGLRRLLYAGRSFADGLPAMTTCFVVTMSFTLVLVLLCVFLTERRSVLNAR